MVTLQNTASGSCFVQSLSLLDTILTLCYILRTYLYTVLIGNRKRSCAHTNSFLLEELPFLDPKRGKRSMCHLS